MFQEEIFKHFTRVLKDNGLYNQSVIKTCYDVVLTNLYFITAEVKEDNIIYGTTNDLRKNTLMSK